jgi:hypothetical protein
MIKVGVKNQSDKYLRMEGVYVNLQKTPPLLNQENIKIKSNKDASR